MPNAAAAATAEEDDGDNEGGAADEVDGETAPVSAFEEAEDDAGKDDADATAAA